MIFRPKPKSALSEGNGQYLRNGILVKYSKSRCRKGWLRDITVISASAHNEISVL